MYIYIHIRTILLAQCVYIYIYYFYFYYYHHHYYINIWHYSTLPNRGWPKTNPETSVVPWFFHEMPCLVRGLSNGTDQIDPCHNCHTTRFFFWARKRWRLCTPLWYIVIMCSHHFWSNLIRNSITADSGLLILCLVTFGVCWIPIFQLVDYHTWLVTSRFSYF